jgi:hypothetical protein
MQGEGQEGGGAAAKETRPIEGDVRLQGENGPHSKLRHHEW